MLSEIIPSAKASPAAPSKIDSAWWDEFLKNSKNFTDTIVVKNVLSEKECHEMTQMALEVIRELCTRKTNAYDFRIYIDGAHKNGDYMNNHVYPYPPMADEDVPTWVNRAFGDQKFGMIINYGEKFSHALSQRLAEYAAPLLKKIGMPLNGMCVTIFLGNYAYTPLGIHQDHKGENVIHFHLGPGGKVMYNWEPDEFKDLPNAKQNCMEIEPLLPYAKKFEFGRSDVFYMPWDKFHVGSSEELSLGVTLWFNNPTRKALMSKILDAIKIQYVNTEDLTITTPEKDLKGFSGFSNIESLLKLEDRHKQLPFKTFLKEVYQEYMYALYSNGGWWARPLSLEQSIEYNENEYEHLADKYIRAISPFRVYYKVLTAEEKLLVFTRASKIEIRYHPALVNILEKINTGETLEVHVLLQELAQDWPEEAGLYFLSLIYNKRGIEIV
ncbi:hypothetical protein [Chitinophaga sp. GbtcB8]|uniref:hypothetical protein n=1 Tax=Chitinophaga sp. GbtcB8 TaxID=2824753 RepID=UPI001C2F9E9C|nr:hypothetical protein [Chitinophaga sp. GbtcB8]